MIYVSFFPLQIPIYFEFLDLTRYQFDNKPNRILYPEDTK